LEMNNDLPTCFG